MKAILFGATGMIGSGVLIELLEDETVEQVLVLGRSSCGQSHLRLKEILMPDLFDYSTIQVELQGYDTCFFCLGISSAGMSESDYTRITFDLTIAAAEAVLAANPNLTFCFVSGMGTDSSENGRAMWARVKGRAENALLKMPFAGAYMFRPGFIQPLKGVRSKTAIYQTMYTILKPIIPLLRRLFPQAITTTEAMGRAMINVAVKGYSKPVLEMKDIRIAAE